ncbi:MAG: rubredoxin [Candidatus Cloacimonetes bacterium]|nr:rubredoxin [Candidatus Cloacimonadota bacterium]
MEKYTCPCGYTYDPKENNDIPFDKLPDDWTCPVCGMGKDVFEKE